MTHERVTNASSTRGRQVAHCVIATILKLSYVFFLDFFKAFDTIEHRFLLEAPHFWDFEVNFFNRVEMLYSDSSSASLNPAITPRFTVSCGIRQGCPTSLKLSILATQFSQLYLLIIVMIFKE